MKQILLSTLLSSLLLTTSIFADSNTTQSVKSSNDKNITSSSNVMVKAKSHQAKLVNEALKSLALSTKALEEINNNKNDEAKKDINLALGQLDALLALKEVPKLLPIENQMVVKNFKGTSKDIDLALKEVKKLLTDGHVQEARILLDTLQSEIDLTTIALPLGSYPDALKLASKYMLDEKPEKAKEVLKLALSTFSEIKEIVPIPLIQTTELINMASAIAQKDKDKALNYLLDASDELDKSEKLGYLQKTTSTYKELHELIEGVKKEIKGENKSENLFKELSKKLKEFKKEISSIGENNKSR
jgi:hypothetical protein